MKVRNRRYCLTRLGFGLNIAPLVMKAVIKTILMQQSEIARPVLPYVDDMLLKEDLVSADQAAAHFTAFGLECKQPHQTVDRARLLVHVQVTGGELHWRCDNTIEEPPDRVTRHTVFA